MQLMMSPASPFVRKVRIALRETGLVSQVKEVTVTTAPVDTAPALASANPLGKIPTLVRADGPAIYDSRVICRFLDTLSAGASLYPQARLWEVLTLEATAEGIMDAAVLITYDGRFRDDDAKARAWCDAQWVKIARGLEVLESRWMPLLTGPVHMGQIATAAALGYLDLRHAARGWRAGHPTLAAWFDQFAQRPSMVETAPA